MLLYLLRHADAETIAENDDARPLSEKGRAQAEKVGRFCTERHLKITALLTSPLRRALETAQLANRHLRAEMAVVGWLASGMRAAGAVVELQAYSDEEAVMLVGHEPDFSALAAHLLGLPVGESLRIRKGSLTLLEMDAPARGVARLDFSLPCRLM